MLTGAFKIHSASFIKTQRKCTINQESTAPGWVSQSCLSSAHPPSLVIQACSKLTQGGWKSHQSRVCNYGHSCRGPHGPRCHSNERGAWKVCASPSCSHGGLRPLPGDRWFYERPLPDPWLRRSTWSLASVPLWWRSSCVRTEIWV